MGIPGGAGMETDAAVDPTEYRCYIKEGDPPICNSGCRSSIADLSGSSSAVQLPITATLNAEHLTLFAAIIHHLAANVNRYFEIMAMRYLRY